jgi:pimeloyl-[acyl-carrier protein] methyl ester esterase
MRKRFAEAPREVLGDFRERIGAPSAPDGIETASLAADLAILAHSSSSRRKSGPKGGGAVSSSSDRHPWVPAFAGTTGNVLVLHGGADPLLPEAMREAVFAGAPRETQPDAGHLLPLTHPAWVADHIRAFAA